MFEETVLESKNAWDENADFWDERMGDNSNYFHCCIVRPGVEELLEVNKNDYVLDVACGTGNFSQRMAEKGAKVVAFDFSSKLIEHAKRRRKSYLNNKEIPVIIIVRARKR
ncbi:class I SAM-dependent methyltransferase [Clostridium ljungdahlii]|uniref:Ubiquinone/menaquinone biosynthesis C-methyltransferase UbiE n=1 Tax=Clostridium ljungdahlii TaxID=1538 RepID=A0A162NC12_9CLOT|nr:class I SAM-dependent methyltransferase [Clostridium ljungdahlii]OAA91619.1 Ubiquinone/menaquinone biosynthesis C-methyltransferase UbiE [Clostridium ljungdahlii]